MRSQLFILTIGLVCSMLVLPSGVAAADALIQAQIAQRDGDYKKCAAFADKARRDAYNTFHAHRLFAICTVSAADEKRPDLSKAAYVAELEKAIEALELLRGTRGARHETKPNEILNLSIEQLKQKARVAANQR